MLALVVILLFVVLVVVVVVVTAGVYTLQSAHQEKQTSASVAVFCSDQAKHPDLAPRFPHPSLEVYVDGS